MLLTVGIVSIIKNPSRFSLIKLAAILFEILSPQFLRMFAMIQSDGGELSPLALPQLAV